MAGCAVGALALVLVDTVLGIVILAASALWLVVRLVVGLRRRRDRERRLQKLLFLDPLIKKLELTETITGRYCLDPATLVVRKVTGTLDAGLGVDPRSRDEGRAAGAGATKGPAATCSMRRPATLSCEVQGSPGSSFHRMRGHPSDPGFGCALKLDDQPWLAGPDGGGDALWNFQLTYSPSPKADGGCRCGLRRPSRQATSRSGQVVGLESPVARLAHPLADPDDPPPLTAKELTSVHVDVPAAWGTVLQVTTDDVEQTVVGFAADGRTRIEWRKPKIAATPRGECMLSVSFDRPIDQHATIDGKIEATFAEAVSGTEGVRMYANGGGRRRDGAKPTVQTKIAVDFALSLAGVRHQTSRTVPDSTKDETETRSFPGTRPDQHLVVQLVQQLSDHRYLVKSVAENPARPGRGVGVQNRVWDVTGRRYRGVHPIDFRLTITGDDAETGSTHPSTTSIRLVVRGVYTTEEMEAEIVAAHEELWGRVIAVIDESNAGADGHLPRREGEPLAGVGTRAAHLKQHHHHRPERGRGGRAGRLHQHLPGSPAARRRAQRPHGRRHGMSPTSPWTCGDCSQSAKTEAHDPRGLPSLREAALQRVFPAHP